MNYQCQSRHRYNQADLLFNFFVTCQASSTLMSLSCVVHDCSVCQRWWISLLLVLRSNRLSIHCKQSVVFLLVHPQACTSGQLIHEPETLCSMISCFTNGSLGEHPEMYFVQMFYQYSYQFLIVSRIQMWPAHTKIVTVPKKIHTRYFAQRFSHQVTQKRRKYYRCNELRDGG